MSPLDVYKKLPRKNCGKCPSGTCMPFAAQFLRRLVSSTDCPELDEQGRQELDAMLSGSSDWKERRLQELFQEIFSVGFSEIAERIGATVKDGELKIRYMGKDIIVTRSGFSPELNIWDKLLVLMYIKTAGSRPLTGKWVPFRQLKDGLIRSESFHEACEQSLARMFGKNPDGFLQKLYGSGAQEAEGFSARHSLIVYPLPKIPFLILLWPADEEFGPDCKVLFDSTVTDYIDVEALLYLGIALVRELGT
ncbi:MAG: DUF3786 domain-containing protein [Nitrospiraceae bacterium]|nr:MAG: DUF3786 domain-containing protein [Nitrospiraceae bacterium]